MLAVSWHGDCGESAGLSDGLEQWASRSDELDRTLPPHVVDAWCGHSGKVRRAHYLMVTESDFAEASGRMTKAAQKAAHSTPVRSHQQPSEVSETRGKQRDFQNDCETKYPRQGSNL